LTYFQEAVKAGSGRARDYIETYFDKNGKRTEQSYEWMGRLMGI
jgi:hypothetical protein